jgi:8-oxo-dGTP diphosphatase
MSERFPALHRPDRWEWAAITMRFSTQVPDEKLVASTHVVAFIDDLVLLCRDAREDVWFLPGGTREPGESVPESLARELLEEAGARLLDDFHPIGAHVGRTEAAQPYRPHLPHPDQAWLWGWADAVVIGPPTNLDGGEAIAEVDALPVLQAAERVTSDTAWAGELILLAAELRAALKSPDGKQPSPAP